MMVQTVSEATKNLTLFLAFTKPNNKMVYKVATSHPTGIPASAHVTAINI